MSGIRLKITRGLVTILCVLGAGCSSLGNNPTGRQEEDKVLFEEFQRGETRLTCRWQCNVFWTIDSQIFRILAANENWPKLAVGVARANHQLDLAYYYLGRAADGLGLPEVAVTYYDLALGQTGDARCNLPRAFRCDGYKFPADVRSRLAVVKPLADRARAERDTQDAERRAREEREAQDQAEKIAEARLAEQRRQAAARNSPQHSAAMPAPAISPVVMPTPR